MLKLVWQSTKSFFFLFVLAFLLLNCSNKKAKINEDVLCYIDTVVCFSDTFGIHCQCDYPLTKKGFILLSDSTRIWIEIEGKGKPLLLIQGGPLFDHQYFHPHFSELVNKNTLIYVDLRGRYMSDESTREKYSILQDIYDLEDIRKKLGIEQWDVLGHSFGGFIALLYALNFPQSVHSTIVVSTPLGISVNQYDSMALVLHTTFFDNVTTREDNIEAQIKANFHSRPIEKDIKYLRKSLEAYNNYEKFTDLITNYMENTESIWSTYLGNNALELSDSFLLTMPLYVITSKQDKIGFWRETEKFMEKQRSTKYSKVYLMENSSHFPFIEEKEKFFLILKDILH